MKLESNFSCTFRKALLNVVAFQLSYVQVIMVSLCVLPCVSLLLLVYVDYDVYKNVGIVC